MAARQIALSLTGDSGEPVTAQALQLGETADPILRLAARCQHLERWRVPRNSFPEGKAGYLKWRQSLYHKQAERARELLLQAGVAEAETAAAATGGDEATFKVKRAEVQALADATREGAALRIDLERCEVVAPGGAVYAFQIQPALREMLLEGLDPVALTLKLQPQIDAFQAADRQARPWVYLPTRPA